MLRMHIRKIGRQDGRQALTTPMFGSMADHRTIPKLDPGHPSILSNLSKGKGLQYLKVSLIIDDI